jgi:hypothetical protein
MASTLAGGPTAGCIDDMGTNARFNDPRGISLRGNLLHVADWGNHVVRTVDVTTGLVGGRLGQCGVAGQTDGGNAVVTFTRPTASRVSSASLARRRGPTATPPPDVCAPRAGWPGTRRNVACISSTRRRRRFACGTTRQRP